MLKMKDAFRRIGPTNNSRRKDTPSPDQATEAYMRSLNGDIFAQSMDENALLSIKEMDDEVFGRKTIPVSASLPQINQDNQPERRKSDISNFSKTRKLTPHRKNSGTRARSAEDIVALVNMEAENTKPEGEKRSQQRRGGSKRSRAKRKQLVQSYEPNKLLEKAVEEGYADLVKNLITSGQVNINKLNGFGFAPLHMAAFEGNIDVVNVFIEQGAYIDILTNTGMSALEIAVIEGNFDCAQLLIGNGADQAFVLDGPLNRRCSKEI